MPSFVPSLLKIKSLLLVTNAKFQAQSALLPTTIYFRPYQHPTPRALPLHQTGLLVLVCITNGGGWIEYGLAKQPLLGSGSCGEGLLSDNHFVES